MRKNQNCKSPAQRLLGAVDLAIDFATLGEYGLEPSPVDGPSRERRGRKTAWEALTTARRGGCAAGAARRTRPRTRDLAA
ncbi:MAG: hypothetical protein ACRDLO_07260 [Solirubrobacterales bacterium]